ncbi:sigma-70 family RNA polymerase sigma factor [Thalassospira sp. MA62]|nr:sigma-70 family RNA polymerase sigma factor [Thalassospira sp. MA62]
MSANQASLALFLRQRSALVNYASSIIGNRVQAEDLVQEAWLRFDEATQSRFLDDATGYLYRIVRNLALDWQRRSRQESTMTDVFDYDVAIEISASDIPDPETVAVYKDDYAKVMRAMAELPDRTRIACEMHRFGGAKLREIAEFLDISVPLAHKLVADGIEHCRDRLGGWP